jgi:hypothetical protein
MHFLSSDEQEKWIEDYLARETAVARKLVQDAETAIRQEIKDVTTGENVGATTPKPETTVDEMLNAIGESRSDPASSAAVQDREDENQDKEDTDLRKLSDDDE